MAPDTPEAVELAPEPTPDPNTDVPFCSSEECRHYDGKRCELMGFRPGSICEPAVIALASDLNAARAEVERLTREKAGWQNEAQRLRDLLATTPDGKELERLRGALESIARQSSTSSCVRCAATWANARATLGGEVDDE